MDEDRGVAWLGAVLCVLLCVLCVLPAGVLLPGESSELRAREICKKKTRITGYLDKKLELNIVYISASCIAH